MTREDKLNWITSIENCAASIAEELGDEVVRSVLDYHGVRSIEDLSPNRYSEVFSSLHAIEMDMK